MESCDEKQQPKQLKLSKKIYGLLLVFASILKISHDAQQLRVFVGNEAEPTYNIPQLATVSVLNAAAAELEAINISFYMYDHPDITMVGDPILEIRRKRYIHHINEEANDQQMLEALRKSPLRTNNSNEADLFVPPIPLASILISASDKFTAPMEALMRQEPFIKHHGNKHLLISTCFALFRQHYRAHTSMRNIYQKIYNMTVVQSWDPVGFHNDFFHNGTDWGDYVALGKEEPESLSRRTISVGLGADNNILGLTIASVEKFHNSSNFIFYQSTRNPSFNNSTIHRHGPINNITLDASFPKSSIGWGLDAESWQREFTSSKFCLNIRGDSPHSHALWRSIRVGCIPVISSNHLSVYAPMFKSTLNMSEYAVILDEQDLLNDPTNTLLQLDKMSEEEIEVKIMHLAFAQRVIFTDHPQSLFVPALLKEAIMAPEAL